MSMNNGEDKGMELPKLMVGEEGQVVMFHDYGKGIVVVSSVDIQPIGHYATNWYMPQFKDYNKPVTIKNVEE